MIYSPNGRFKSLIISTAFKIRRLAWRVVVVISRLVFVGVSCEDLWFWLGKWCEVEQCLYPHNYTGAYYTSKHTFETHLFCPLVLLRHLKIVPLFFFPLFSVDRLSTWLRRWWKYLQTRRRSTISAVIFGASGWSCTFCSAAVHRSLATVEVTVAGSKGKPAVHARWDPACKGIYVKHVATCMHSLCCNF